MLERCETEGRRPSAHHSGCDEPVRGAAAGTPFPGVAEAPKAQSTLDHRPRIPVAADHLTGWAAPRGSASSTALARHADEAGASEVTEPAPVAAPAEPEFATAPDAAELGLVG